MKTRKRKKRKEEEKEQEKEKKTIINSTNRSIIKKVPTGTSMSEGTI